MIAKSSTSHNYSFLPTYYVGEHFADPSYDEESKTWSIRVGSRKGDIIAQIPNLQRADILIILACMGCCSFRTMSIQEVLDLAKEMRQEIDRENPFGGLCYHGVHMEIYFHANGKWGVEIEPGVGTTIASMSLTTAEDAYRVLQGLLWMLKDDYLARPKPAEKDIEAAMIEIRNDDSETIFGAIFKGSMRAQRQGDHGARSTALGRVIKEISPELHEELRKEGTQHACAHKTLAEIRKIYAESATSDEGNPPPVF